MPADRHSTVLVVGGGIGGLATALAAARCGLDVRVLERAPKFDEIGAGLQMGPNATRMLARLGVLDEALATAVRPARATMLDALTGDVLTTLELGASCEARYGYPYVVMHRRDLLDVLKDACDRDPLIDLVSGVAVDVVTAHGEVGQATCADRHYTGGAMVGADGLWSTVRRLLDGSEPEYSGFVAYRGAIAADETTSVHGDDVLIWIGPGLHLVQYPVRRGELYNQVAVFRSDAYRAGEEDRDIGAEMEQRFAPTCPPVQHGVAQIPRERRWPIFDRPPLARWTEGRVTLLGDAAHPMLQYLGQGACQALEDAVVLAAQLAAHRDDVPLGLKLYEQLRLPRTSRCQLSARPWGALWHSTDPLVIGLRNRLFQRRAGDDYQDVDWLYDEAEELRSGVGAELRGTGA